MKKEWVIGCGIAAVLAVGLCAGTGFFFFRGVVAATQPVVDASEQFLVLLGQGKTSEAYASTASRIRLLMDEATFAQSVERLDLSNYASASWPSRQINNSEGSAEGTVSTKDGGSRPIAVQLIYEDGAWKVLGVRYGGVELVASYASSPVPSEAELEWMVMDSLMDLNEGVQAGDLTAFYGTIADLWKKDTTPQQLKATFQDWFDRKIDIGPIKDLKPQFSPPAEVTDQGWLVVAGHYKTTPSRLEFELKYVPERGTWKLAGIYVNIDPSAP